MTYVVYSSSHIRVQERKRTPLGRAAAWLLVRVADTALQGAVSFVVNGPVLVRLAFAITTGLILGAFVDLTVHWIAPASSAFFAASVTLGIGGGFAAGGPPGAVLGLIWAWIIGGIVDALAADQLTAPVRSAVGAILPDGWFATSWASALLVWTLTMCGAWVIGLGASRVVERLTRRRPFWRRTTAAITTTIALGSLLLAAGAVLSWLVTGRPLTSATALAILSWAAGYWRWWLLAALWSGTLAGGVAVLVAMLPPVSSIPPPLLRVDQSSSWRATRDPVWNPETVMRDRRPEALLPWRDHPRLILGYMVSVNAVVVISVWLLGGHAASIGLAIFSALLWGIGLLVFFAWKVLPHARWDAFSGAMVSPAGLYALGLVLISFWIASRGMCRSL